MVSSTTRMEPADPLASLALSPSSSSNRTTSFARQLATTFEGYLNRSKKAPEVDVNAPIVQGQNSGGSQVLVSRTTNTPPDEIPTMLGMGPVAGTAPVAQNTEAKSIATKSPPVSLPASPSSSDAPTMLGMGPVAGTAPVAEGTDAEDGNTGPVTEADAYWAQQPAAVQALRDMPDSAAKDKLALSLANQGYAIDTQIMVWGWDPQMTMTVRENQGYSWVPSYGQSNVPVGPGISDPFDPISYDPASPPPGSIQVSTAFAVGTIQNPLVQTDPTST